MVKDPKIFLMVKDPKVLLIVIGLVMVGCVLITGHESMIVTIFHGLMGLWDLVDHWVKH